MEGNIQVYIGYDPRQPVAFQTLAHSVWSRSTAPVAITRIQLSQLPITRRGLTEFTFSRYLVPWLSGYKGYSIFFDSDIICLGDVTELMKEAIEECNTTGAAVCVVKHDRVFERPSVMVFNNALCTTLTPEWVQDEKNNPFNIPSWAPIVGSLQKHWNHLVGYDTPNSEAKVIHFTMGVPCWPETNQCEFSKEWLKEAKNTVATVSYAELMGKSVHHQHVTAGALKQS